MPKYSDDNALLTCFQGVWTEQHPLIAHRFGFEMLLKGFDEKDQKTIVEL